MSGREDEPKPKRRRDVKGSCSKEPNNKIEKQPKRMQKKTPDPEVVAEYPNPEEGSAPQSLPVNQELSQVMKLDPTKYVGNEYLLESKLEGSIAASIQYYLAKSEHTGEFYVIKVLTLKDSTADKKDEQFGKNLILKEHSLLSLLANEPGIFQEHGLIKDTFQEKIVSPEGEVTWIAVRRFSLIIDCYFQHDHSPSHCKFISLLHHVIAEKRLREGEAIRMFYKMVTIVNRLHELNVIHKDLKLGNFILNRVTEKVKLTNFGLGHHLGHEHQPLRDQCGTLGYLSPEVISGKAYFGKPADMWSLGVAFYIMVNGHYPFGGSDKATCYHKIRTGLDFSNPIADTVSPRTRTFITSLLDVDWKKRPTASAALKEIIGIIAEEHAFLRDSDEQVVPLSDPRGAKRRATLIVHHFARQDMLAENGARLQALINGEEQEMRTENQEGEREERTPRT